MDLLRFIYGYMLVNTDVVSALWVMFPLDSLFNEDTVVLILGTYLEILTDLSHDLLFEGVVACHEKIVYM